jgi:hypothetical protein
MKMLLAVSAAALAVSFASAQTSHPPPSTAQSIKRQFTDVNRKVLAMAKDFPADKYDFRLKPEMRSFGEVIIHIASGNVFATKIGRGENVNWDELDPKKFSGKEAIVAEFEKSVKESEAVLDGVPDASLEKTARPWIGVLEHSAEHYGLLVAYYRANGLVPPESRPQH